MTDLAEDNRLSGNQKSLQSSDLFRHAPTAILRTTLDGNIVVANQAFADMPGYISKVAGGVQMVLLFLVEFMFGQLLKKIVMFNV